MEKLDDNQEGLTFENFDKLGRKEFADRLTTVITKFYPFYDEAFVLSLNAKFGAGKTTFLEMWKNQLMEADFKVISINAWETDFDDEPLIPIISALLDGIPSDKKFAEAKNALKGTLATIAFAANDVISHVTGVDVDETIKKVDSSTGKENIQAIGDKFYKEYSFKMKAYETLKLKVSNYIEAMPKKPLIIFVDELDRVRPDYSVKFLEAIKHIFSLPGVCFVLAINREQMEASVRQLYGDINFENYYGKFITREADLAETKNLDLMPFIQSQTDHFFAKAREAGVNFAFKEQNQGDFSAHTAAICSAFNFAPRQIETLLRMFFQLMAVETTQETGTEAWMIASILLIAISIGDERLYNRLGTGLVPAQELHGYIKTGNFKNPKHHKSERFIIMTAMSFSIKLDDKNELSRTIDICIKEHGWTNASENREFYKREMEDALTGPLDRMHGTPEISGFQKIYTQIEEWKPFID